MADDNPQTTDPADTGEATEAHESQQKQQTRTFTQEEVNAMVAARLAKAEKAMERRLAEAVKKAEERAKLGDVERLQAERDELAKKLEHLEAERQEALLKVQLAGKVTDVDYALFKARQNPDKYVGEDGKLDIDALLKDHPSLKAQPDPKPGPAPTTAGGGGARGFDMNAAIRKAAGRT